jgi:hypothetical protein
MFPLLHRHTSPPCTRNSFKFVRTRSLNTAPLTRIPPLSAGTMDMDCPLLRASGLRLPAPRLAPLRALLRLTTPRLMHHAYDSCAPPRAPLRHTTYELREYRLHLTIHTGICHAASCLHGTMPPAHTMRTASAARTSVPCPGPMPCALCLARTGTEVRGYA